MKPSTEEEEEDEEDYYAIAEKVGLFLHEEESRRSRAKSQFIPHWDPISSFKRPSKIQVDGSRMTYLKETRNPTDVCFIIS